MEKTTVEMTHADQDGDWKQGERGYIDGYVFNGERPYVAIVLGEKVVLALNYQFRVLNNA